MFKGHDVWGSFRGLACCAGKLCVFENSHGWLVAWGMCEYMLIRSSAVWIPLFNVY